MEEEKTRKKPGIEFGRIASTVWANKKRFVKVWVITFALSCLWILPQPRYYTSEVSIAPESADTKELGSLASLASNFGVNMGNGTADAIYPQLYPDLFKSTNFLVGLLDIRVHTKDNKVDTDYYTYLKDHQKNNWLLWPIDALRGWIKSLTEEEETEQAGTGGRRFDPFRLSKTTDDIVNKVKGSIVCNYSRTTDVVSIGVTDQDPLVCALLADSIKEHLQVFITDYRTKKARIDYEHYATLAKEAQEAYETARQKYASYVDAHTNVAMKSVETKMDALENDMQSKFNIYTTLFTRQEAAMAKIQENTPAFTTLKNATVPLKPAGPKRMIFVAFMLFLATIGTVVHLFRKELIAWF